MFALRVRARARVAFMCVYAHLCMGACVNLSPHMCPCFGAFVCELCVCECLYLLLVHLLCVSMPDGRNTREVVIPGGGVISFEGYIVGRFIVEVLRQIRSASPTRAMFLAHRLWIGGRCNGSMGTPGPPMGGGWG